MNIRDIEQATLGQLISAREGALCMEQLFQEDGLASGSQKWAQVTDLLGQAVTLATTPARNTSQIGEG